MKKLTKTFDRKGTFNALHDAEKFLRDRGFSLGSSQADGPQGIMFGDYAISKWRNMGKAEISALHGVMRGDGREGPLTIFLLDHAPDEAKAAFLADDAAVKLAADHVEALAINAAGHYYSATEKRADGVPLMLNPDGTRSIFCDIDEDGPGCCPACNGSGEGTHDGATCSLCRGKGEL